MPASRSSPLSRVLTEVIRVDAESNVAAWISAAARLKLAASKRRGVPTRWLDQLVLRLSGRDPSPSTIQTCLDELERVVPGHIVRGPEFLGMIHQLARSASLAPRSGRAGRKSEPVVYTPWTLAERMARRVPVDRGLVIDPACGAGILLLAVFKRAMKKELDRGVSSRRAARSVLSRVLVGIDLDPIALALAEFNLRLAAWEAGGLRDDVPIDLRQADALGPLKDLEGSTAAAIGNPPFVEGRGLTTEELRELRRRFQSARKGKVNLFTIFVERGIELLRAGGTLSFVIPSTFARNDRYEMFRGFLLGHSIERVEAVPPGTFAERVVETDVLTVRKGKPNARKVVSLPSGKVPQRELPLGPTMRFCLRLSRDERRSVARMVARGVPLATLFEVRDGISTGFQPFPKRLLGRVKGKHFLAEDGTRLPFDAGKHRRVIDGSEFSAFTPIHWEGRWIEHDKRHEHDPPHPGRPFNCQLRDARIYDRTEKLLTRQTARGLIATVDRDRFFVRNSVHVTFIESGGLSSNGKEADLSIAALCACLNSDLYDRYFLAVTGEDGHVYPQVHIADLKRLPLLPDLLAVDGELHGIGEDLLRLHAKTAQGSETRIERKKAEVEKILRDAFC